MIINKSQKKDRPLIMGILNLTPDSFSDGGVFNTDKEAIKRAIEMEKEGADIIDIGGESTGVESKHVSEKEELLRVIPILKKIRRKTDIPISIDTYKSEVARQALEEGANIINDVTAFRGDPEILDIVSKYNCPYILMYTKDNSPRTTIKKKKYKDILRTIKTFFLKRISLAEEKIKKEKIILDPGMGQFISAIPKYSFEIISRLKELKEFNLPILLGISRKSFLGGDIKNRDEKGKILSAIAYLNGASIIRTHDVKGVKEFFERFNN